jgi:hypothetical protein
MSYNVMIGYDIYDSFTMEHFQLRQRMTLTTKIYCSRLYIKSSVLKKNHNLKIKKSTTKNAFMLFWHNGSPWKFCI